MSAQLQEAIELIGCQLVNDTIHILQMQGLASEDCGKFTSIPKWYIDQILAAIEEDIEVCHECNGLGYNLIRDEPCGKIISKDNCDYCGGKGWKIK